ncbi:MAG: hypothetical protein M3N53_02940 [Actinomycetota bacterium]|nr:hypothetical protein [Actinomycetota bacterium]
MSPVAAGGGRIALDPESLLRLAAGCGEAAAELATIRLQAVAVAGAVGETLDLTCSLPECERWLRERAIDLVQRVRFLVDEESTLVILGAIGLLKGIDQTTHGVTAVRLHKQMRRAWELYSRALSLDEFGRYGDLRSLGRWLKWQETVSAWGLPIDWARAVTNMGDDAVALGQSVRFGKVAVRWTQVGHGTDIVRSVKWARGLSRALGPVGFVTDAVVVWQGSEYAGIRGDADRALALGGLVTGAAAVGATALGLAAAPALVTLAGAAAVTGAVWSVGNLAWDNRDDIGQAITSTVEWTGDRIEEAGEAIGDAAEAVGGAVGDAVDNVADAVTFWD